MLIKSLYFIFSVLPVLIASVTSYFSLKQFKDQNKQQYVQYFRYSVSGMFEFLNWTYLHIFSFFFSSCVIQGVLFYVTTLAPVSITLLFNVCLFIPIIRGIHAHLTRKARFQQNDSDLLGRVRVTVSTMVLLGVTWVFGLLAVGSMRTTFQWIFSILNSFQGFFIFVFHVARSKEAKSAWCRTLGIEYDYYSTSSRYSATSPSRYTSRTTTSSHSLSIIKVKTHSVSSVAR